MWPFGAKVKTNSHQRKYHVKNCSAATRAEGNEGCESKDRRVYYTKTVRNIDKSAILAVFLAF